VSTVWSHRRLIDWGLRDYGTATWLGGDAACDHKERSSRGDAGRLSTDTRPGINPAPNESIMQYKGTCGKCGAARVDMQLGLEPTPDEYVANMVKVFQEVKRVLRDDGTLWLNLGDSYAGTNNGYAGDHCPSNAKSLSRGMGQRTMSQRNTVVGGLKPKDLCGIPWRVAFALQADGWWLRSDIIWSKPNPMPESVTDRPTKAHEYLFLLSKRPTYFYDADAVKEEAEYGRRDWGGADQHAAYMRSRDNLEERGDRKTPESYTKGGDPSTGRNRRTVWEIPTAPYSGAHFATFPPALVEPCVLAGTSPQVCAVCGAPWERAVEKGQTMWEQRKSDGAPMRAGDVSGGISLGRAEPNFNGKKHSEWKAAHPDTHTGWRPTCRDWLRPDEAPIVPATVLDPFCGSGTVGQVARLHGRRFVGLDINGVYLRELALPRAEGTQTAASMATLPLFGGLLEPVGAETPKQDRVGKRTYTGFNARWDAEHG
jgi:DNA modification methylase